MLEKSTRLRNVATSRGLRGRSCPVIPDACVNTTMRPPGASPSSFSSPSAVTSALSPSIDASVSKLKSSLERMRIIACQTRTYTCCCTALCAVSRLTSTARPRSQLLRSSPRLAQNLLKRSHGCGFWNPMARTPGGVYPLENSGCTLKMMLRYTALSRKSESARPCLWSAYNKK